MKLNPDCVRQTLLYLEEATAVEVVEDRAFGYKPVFISQICSALKNYSKEDVFYSLSNLEQAGYIAADRLNSDGYIVEYVVLYITHSGHEFIGTIQPDGIWGKALPVLMKFGSVSMSLISSVAGNFLTEKLTQLI